MADSNPVRRLNDYGQSVWLDFIERSFVRDGGLAKLISEDGVSGVTSNPAIFHKAFVGERIYDEAIGCLVRQGRSADNIAEALIVDDISDAAELLAPVHAASRGIDGYVSLEVSPHLARNSKATCQEARRLWSRVARSNLMIKVPGTAEGVPAIRTLIAEGINVNITLLFSVERYAQVAEAYIAGLEDRVERGLPIDASASVASFFLSRIDSLVDAQLDATKQPHTEVLRGKLAITYARAAYAHYHAAFAGARWRKLADRGARVQRLLWASTSTKDPAYSDVKYVESLIGPDTITTLPPETLNAYRDHGRPSLTLSVEGVRDAAHEKRELELQLARAGVEVGEVATRLEAEGIRKFIEPYEAMLEALRNRRA